MIPRSQQSGSCLKPMIIALFVFLSFLLHPSVLQARAVLYDGRDGLNSNDVSGMAKDNRGLIWIGTFNGLNIFDGYTFSKFHKLSSVSVTNLKNDPYTNELLVGTTDGFFKVGLEDLSVHKIIYSDNKEQKLSIGWTQAICINPTDKQVYFSIRGGYIAKVEDGNKFSIVCRLKDPSSEVTELIALDATHLIANNGVLNLIDIKTGIASIATYPGKTINVRIQSLATDGNRLLFCDDSLKAYAASIMGIDKQKGTILVSNTYNLPDNPVKIALKGGKLYCLGLNYSFVTLNLATNNVENLSQKYPAIFEGKVYHSLSIDENDVIWAGTNKGIIKVNEHFISFEKELSNIPIRISTREIYQTGNGDLYVCSYAGLWYLPKGTKEWIRYGDKKPITAANEYKLNVQPIAFLYNPAGDFFYVGMDGPTILKFDTRRKIFETLDHKFIDPSGKPLASLSDIEMDRNGRIWMGTSNGVGFYDQASNTLEMQRKGKFNIGDVRVRQLYYEKASGLMYIGTVNGLFIVDIDKGILKHYTTNTVPALNNNNVLCIDKDDNKNIWLGTNGGGINIITDNGKNVKYIRRQDGLSSEIVYSIVRESNNIFWFGTFNGLNRYQKDKNSFFNFFEEDGLSSNEFNQNSFLKTKDNRFYFGSINGITTFRPQQFLHSVPFHIYFAGISKWDDKTQSIQLFLQNLKTGSEINKTPSDQLVELHFGCSDYSDPQRNSYSYRIREISENWISLDERHTLNIGGLPYGTFTLEVKATNSRGGASSNILYYDLNIHQPFYRTWWFFTLVLLAVGLVFYGAYLIKYQSFKRVLHLRMKIASNLHDEVGSLLTRITMFSENLRYSKNNEEQRNIKLEKIAVLSRNAVASMSDVLWAIDSRNDFAGNLLDRMREHAEEMLFPLGIDVNFVLSVSDLKRHIDSDTRGEMYLIYKEAINNIAKHSNATHVEIYYSFHDKHFHLKISNNGIKEPVSEISTGQGLDNMKMRAKKIGAQITVEKKDDNFTIELKN